MAMGNLEEKDQDLLHALTVFVTAVSREAQQSEDFAQLVEQPLKDFFDVHVNDPTTCSALEDDEQLKSRYLKAVYKLEVVADLIKDSTVCPLAAPKKQQLLKLYDDFRMACSEKCGLPTGQERK